MAIAGYGHKIVVDRLSQFKIGECENMGITNSNKQISSTQIDCDGTLKVTLALTATPDIVSNPTDIVLVLDRSGSMTGAPLVRRAQRHSLIL